MTFTPREAALASMAAPEPESRFTSRSTFAPFVISCSACCCWVDLSPWALSIVTGTPADLKAACSSTPTFWALVAAVPELLLLVPDDELLSSEPHAATANAITQSAMPMARARREIGECITVFLLLWDGTYEVRVRSVGPRTRGRREPARRATRRGRRACRRRS